MEYSEEVRRRFQAPVGVGAVADDEPSTLTGEAQDRALSVWARCQVMTDAGRISAIRFHVFGCPHTIAAASLLAELLAGQPLAALESAWAMRLVARLQVPKEKLGRLLVLEDALRACARSNEQGW